MVQLALEHAPAAAHPGRFLRTVPAWGALAGLMLLAAYLALARTQFELARSVRAYAIRLAPR
ncbi:hypothetical protein [Arenimonas alkanexedens]